MKIIYNKNLKQKKITAKSINETVSKYYGIPIEDIKGKRKELNISNARQICMYLCRKLTDMSFVIIGNEYGNRHFTTVIHAIDSIEKSIKNDKEVASAIETMIMQLTGTPVKLNFSKDIHSSVIEKEEVIRITTKSINETVSKYYGIPIEDIKGKRKTQDISDARQICMYLCRKLTDMSFVVIGSEYGNRHYTTVIHAVDNIEKSIKHNKEVASAIETMTKQLKSILK